jgi:CRP-like cAMP-binding protein
MSDLPLVSPLDRVLFLRAQPHFAQLEPAVLVVIANHLEEQSFRKGEIILDASDPRRFIHFLVEGTVRTTLAGNTPFDISSPGSVGLVHHLARSSRSSGAVALTDVVSLRIELEGFLQIMEDCFPVIFEITQNLTEMIASAEEALNIAPGADDCVACRAPASDETLDLVQRLTRARRAELFQKANLTMLTELLRETPESYLEQDEWLFRAGEQPESLYLIFEGAVRIEDRLGKRIAFASPGEMVALADCCRNEPHTFGAVTETPVQLLRIDKPHYIDVLEDHFEHALDLLAELAQRYLELSARIHTGSSGMGVSGSSRIT